jgi:xylose dehydrogenase (NAD/NADP)
MANDVDESAMNERRVRWGVLSTANIGRAAVNPAIQASSNGELVAVASRDGARAKAFAEAHGIPHAHGSYEALLERDDVDAVYVPLPNSLHREWTVRAALAGKHVLCEKPMALSAAECDEMAAAAEETGVKLMEAFMYRFHPRTERLVEMIRSGGIGALGAIRSVFTFRLTKPDNIRLDPTLGGGALMDVGCYCVNVARTVSGEEPVEVVATARWTERGVDESMAGILRFPGDVFAHFDCSLALERSELVEIGGADGCLRIPAAFLPGTGDVDIENVRGRGAREAHRVEGVDQYVRMVEHFGDCVLLNRQPRYGVAEAAANMRVIEALYRSARDGGRPVTL